MLEILLAGMLAAATAADKYCTVDESGYCQDSSISYSLIPGVNKIRVRVAAGTVFVVRIPEGDEVAGVPSIGTVTLLNSELSQEGQRQVLKLWPKVPEGLTQEGIEGLSTNVQISFGSGVILILEIQITTKKGSELLILSDPTREAKRKSESEVRAQVRQEIEQEYRRMKEGIRDEINRGRLELLMKDMMKRYHCEGLRERATRELLVVWGRRICHVGDHLYIEFEIQNRSRSLFELGKIEFFGVKDEKLEPHEAVVGWQDGKRPELHFDQSAKGMAAFPLRDDETAPEYAIKVTEAGGKMRVVTLKGIEF